MGGRAREGLVWGVAGAGKATSAGSTRALPVCECRAGGWRVVVQLLGDLGGSLQDRLWNRDSKRLGGLEVDHDVEDGWKLDRQVDGPGAFQKLVQVAG